ncbi:phage tail spike protein [Streptococcus sp. WB01_FAA12]|uniref:phage tail spike protein n=1 Tax=Streptococcus sp. WB01_FAA12 TaxID=2725308 RepID=UPI00146B283D|nr:phage tail spike protein [Streptococcus sp. WB01_FAA12]NMD84187.1 hypothetical protein [Streptococcus sp. WB01_FAA12]NMD84236.1 hypothetical protein [Streptococcus sp. WB01_FAA12]
MIYLTNGNMPLNAAYADEIVQEDNSTYQLTFRFPTSDPLWEKLKEETFLTADDLHGEQDFVIFEVEKKHGYIQVYANQVFTLLNNYVVNPISLDRATGSTALSRFAGAITRNNPFSFFSDIEDRHTFNIGSKNAMEAFAKDKHSIIGQWGGDLVRHGYQVRLLKNGGSENESLFMYKKNLSSYQHKTSTKSLKTRITFKTTVKGEGEKAPDRKFSVVVDSPLINKYSQIYEDVIEVNDEDVKDEASLRKYGEQYFKTSLCDMMEDSLELEVVGQSDVPVQIYDIVSLFYEIYNLDVRKKITKYTYSPMAKKLKSIGFGQFQSGLANAIGNAVNDAVKGEAQQLQDDFERQLARELKNADLAFDRQKEELVNQFTDGLNAAKARAEEVKRELSDTIDQRFNSFNNGPLQEVKRRTEEALKNSGASSLLAQEAKRIGLDSVARLEAFKSQATSAQTALSGELDSLKRTIANDIRPKQAQAEAEIAKQVEALIQTKKELAGVKSAQATYEETTTRRLSELTNLANGKASKSELTQTAEELASKIASVQVGGTNLYALSRNKDILRSSHLTDLKFDISSGEISFKATGLDPYFGEATTHPKTVSSRNGVRIPVIAGKSIYVTISNPVFAKNFISYFDERGNTVKRYQYYGANSFAVPPRDLQGVSFITLRFGCGGSNFEIGDVLKTKIKVEYGTIPTDWSPAPEDQDERVSAVESTFKQKADSLEAGVNRLTEGLRTKADISSLNVTAENIRQSVKQLETNTQNKLDQKLSLAEFEVRAGSIRQEILNVTKEKADKTLVTTEAGKLREEFASLRVGGRNLLKGSKGPFKPDKNPANFDNQVLYYNETSMHLVQNERYRISAKTDGMFTATHEPNKESDNVVLWLMDKTVTNYQIVSSLKTGTTGTEFVWSCPTGTYHLRVNTYRKDPEKLKSVWEVKVEQGSFKTDWSPAPEDTEGLITEAKATFERTALGLRTDLSAIQEYVNKDGQRQETLQRYTREESAKQATAVRELVNRDFVGKASYQEDVRGIERKFEAITNPQNGSIATQIATYKTAVDGRFAEITSMISGKANQADFQRVRETSQLYERILGNTENGIADKVARMAMTSQLFQVEVSKNEGLKTVQSQLAGSWGVHNKNSVNEIIAGFNLAGKNAGIKAETIRLEGRTLLDELTAIQGYFKRLFVGEGTFATLNTDILRANSITADKLVMDIAMARRFVSSDIFTDTLAAKEAFINKLRSVVVTATLLEGYKGRIGGFQIGTHEKDSSVYWITGQNQFSVGMSNGTGQWSQTALWVNWGNNWGYPGDYAWYVKNNGKMYCYNTAEFWNTPVIHGDLRVTGHIFYNNKDSGKSGYWIHSSKYSNFEPSDNYLYMYYSGSGYDWIPMNKEISDRRYKHNIEDSTVSGLDVIQKLKTYSYRKEYDGKIEDIACGIIAQDVQKYAPEAFFENPDGAYSYNTFALVPYLIKAIQELNHKIEKLEETA